MFSYVGPRYTSGKTENDLGSAYCWDFLFSFCQQHPSNWFVQMRGIGSSSFPLVSSAPLLKSPWNTCETEHLVFNLVIVYVVAKATYEASLVERL